MTDATPVEREAVDVMFIRTQDDPADMRRGWERLSLEFYRRYDQIGLLLPVSEAPKLR